MTTTSSKARIKVPPIPNPPDFPPVSVQGQFADAVLIIPKAAATLHVLPGRLRLQDEKASTKVLVPFAEIQLRGRPIAKSAAHEKAEKMDEFSPIFAQSLPLENLAFLLLDLTNSLKRMCGEITELSQGKLAVDPARMASVRYFVAHLERQAQECRISLDKAYGAPQKPDE